MAKKNKNRVPNKFVSSGMLNKPGFHSTAAISVNANYESVSTYSEEWVFPSVHGTITISDCSRTVSLELSDSYSYGGGGRMYKDGEFNVEGNDKLFEDLRNTIYKLEQLESKARNTREYYERAREEIIRDIKAARAENEV